YPCLGGMPLGRRPHLDDPGGPIHHPLGPHGIGDGILLGLRIRRAGGEKEEDEEESAHPPLVPCAVRFFHHRRRRAIALRRAGDISRCLKAAFRAFGSSPRSAIWRAWMRSRISAAFSGSIAPAAACISLVSASMRAWSSLPVR